MPVLRVSNGYQQHLDGLGKVQAFSALSEKRITKCTREALRKQFGFDAIEVSCSAIFDGASWLGQCRISGQPLKYRISTQ